MSDPHPDSFGRNDAIIASPDDQGLKGGPNGPFTLWTDFGYEGWHWKDFNTLQEALEADKHGPWHISKPVRYAVTEAE